MAKEVSREGTHTCEWCAVIKAVYDCVNCGETYQYNISQPARMRLRELTELPLDDHLGAIDGPDVNRHIRDQIGPLLLGEEEQRKQAAAWIVGDWGGIRRGLVAVEQWSIALQTYLPETVANFVAEHGWQRVSSWSKLLSFACPDVYAIYDARTTVALNLALRALGDERRFYMPLTQSKAAQHGRLDIFRSAPATDYLGYWRYMALLRCLSSCGLATGVLDAEMKVFANSKKLVAKFARLSPCSASHKLAQQSHWTCRHL